MANAFFRHVLPVIKGRMHQNDKPLFQANHSLLKAIFNVADINKDIRDVIFYYIKWLPTDTTTFGVMACVMRMLGKVLSRAVPINDARTLSRLRINRISGIGICCANQAAGSRGYQCAGLIGKRWCRETNKGAKENCRGKENDFLHCFVLLNLLISYFFL